MSRELDVVDGQTRAAPPESPTDTLALRARRFPTAQSYSLSPRLSRRTTESREIAFRNSMGSINEEMVGPLFSGTGPHSSPVDPFMTVMYPGRSGSGELVVRGESESPRGRDNLGKSQVRVEGYFQDNSNDNDTMGVLIPNDLPRSTILYVLTASEGRDKLFKGIQYGLQIMICFLKRPGLFSPESQGLVDYWSERFLRNSNTVRHGRGLFKVGRWLLNLFFLQEIYDRLALKHGNQVRGLINKIKADLARFLYLPDSDSLRESKKKKKKVMHTSPNGMDDRGSNSTGSLITDDMFLCVARAEDPWRHSTISHPMPVGRDNGRRSEHDNNPTEPDAARRFYLKERIMKNGIEEVAMTKLQRQPDEGEKLHDGINKNSTQACASLVDAAGEDLLLSPPLLHSTLPALPLPDDGRCRAERETISPPGALLQPLRESNTSAKDCLKNGNNNNGVSGGDTLNMNSSINVDGKYDDECNASENNVFSYSGYFSSYQTLPYEPRLGDALPSPRNAGNKLAVSRSAGSTLGNMEEGESFEVPNSNGNGSDDNLYPTSDDARRDREGLVHGQMQSLPAEMGYPAHWRKRIQQFSTPLMLLLGIRSVATIGRRVLRDILLLSSKHFLNILNVEKNRPGLQRHSNWLWLAVSGIDLLLNTIRLLEQGWYKYATARHSSAYHCNCKDNDEANTLFRYRGLVAQRKTNLVFPPTDLDYGAPICSSPAYFEAADPRHIAPSCRICGCLFVETPPGKGDGVASRGGVQQQQGINISSRRVGGVNGGTTYNSVAKGAGASLRARKRSIGETAELGMLYIPWLMRKLFNYIWLLHTHSNWTATILLQVRYIAEVFLAFQYCFGGYETGKGDASLEEILHPFGAIAGFVSAVVGLQRVIESAPK